MSTACDAWLGRHKEPLEWPGAGIGTQWSQELKGRLFWGENSFNFVLVIRDSLTYDLHLDHNLRNPTCQLLYHLAVQAPQRRNPGLPLSSTAHFRDDLISAQIVYINMFCNHKNQSTCLVTPSPPIFRFIHMASPVQPVQQQGVLPEHDQWWLRWKWYWHAKIILILICLNDIDMPKWYWHA